MTTTQIQTITYNPASRAFEARVILKDAGEEYTSPCALRAPLDMDTTVVSRQLAEMASRRHARDHRPMHSHRPEHVLGHVPAEVASVTDALWQRLLGRAA